MKKFFIVGMFAIVFFSPGMGAARGDDFVDMSLDELLRVKIDSASMQPQAAADVPATVYLVDHREMELYGYRDLKDVLRNLPGVAYGDPHSWLQGGQRGLSGGWAFSKILLNGRPTNLLWSGEAYIGNQFPLHNVRRVELIQGPASALYGADAFSGVINIVTDTPGNSEDYSKSEAVAGTVEKSLGNRSLSMAVVRHHGRWGLALAACTYEGGGPDYTGFISSSEYSQVNTAIRAAGLKGPSPYRDDDRSSTGNLIVSYGDGDRGASVGFYFLRNRDGGGIENAELSYTDFRDIRRQLHTFLKYHYRAPGAPLRLKIDLHRLVEDDRVEFQSRSDISVLPPPLYEFRVEHSRMNRGRLQADYEFRIAKNYMSLGVESEDIAIGAPSYPLSDFSTLNSYLSQRKNSIFIQDQQQLPGGRSRLILGGRYDHHNIYGEVTTFRGGVGLKPSLPLDLKLLYGEAFREPTVFELSTNAALVPARIKTSEAAVVYTLPRLTLQGSLYYSRATDLIEQDRGGGNISRNCGVTGIQGMEFLGRWRRGNFRGDLWYSLVDRDDDLDVPQHTVGLGIVWLVSRTASLAVRGRYAAGVDTEARAADSSLFIAHVPEYHRVDLTLVSRRRQLPATGILCDYSLSVFNLFDRSNYYPNVRGPDPIMYQGEGRTLYLKGIFYY